MHTDKNITISELKKQVRKFIDERDWHKYHTPKNLAMSISIESAELMEIFQWLTPEESMALKEHRGKKFEQVKEEIADIMAYCLSLANVLDIDITRAALDKFEKNRRKYPADKYRGKFELE